MASSYTYRKLWELHHGPIPKDSDGRKHEIHHINGNHNDNRIENLKLLTIQEHYEIHKQQGDWGACLMIAKRMGMSPDELSNIQKGKKRPGIGGVKKGTIPWNKGRTELWSHSESSLLKISLASRGENSASSKLSEKDVKKIRKDFENKVFVDFYDKNVKPTKNTKGIYPTYLGAFAATYGKKYGVTDVNIKRIIQRKTWKHTE